METLTRAILPSLTGKKIKWIANSPECNGSSYSNKSFSGESEIVSIDLNDQFPITCHEVDALNEAHFASYWPNKDNCPVCISDDWHEIKFEIIN
jgi:hypothetical protein